MAQNVFKTILILTVNTLDFIVCIALEMLHLKMLLSVDDDTLGWAGTKKRPVNKLTANMCCYK